MKTTKEYFIEGQLVPEGTEIEVINESITTKKLTEAKYNKETMHDAVWLLANGWSMYETLTGNIEKLRFSYDESVKTAEQLYKDRVVEEKTIFPVLNFLNKFKVILETVEDELA